MWCNKLSVRWRCPFMFACQGCVLDNGHSERRLIVVGELFWSWFCRHSECESLQLSKACWLTEGVPPAQVLPSRVMHTNRAKSALTHEWSCFQMSGEALGVNRWSPVCCSTQTKLILTHWEPLWDAALPCVHKSSDGSNHMTSLSSVRTLRNELFAQGCKAIFNLFFNFFSGFYYTCFAMFEYNSIIITGGHVMTCLLLCCLYSNIEVSFISW